MKNNFFTFIYNAFSKGRILRGADKVFRFGSVLFLSLFFVRCAFSEAIVEDTVLYIPRGTTWEVLRDSLARRVAKPNLVDGDGEPRAGYYKLHKGLTYRELTRTFERGWQTPVRVTFNNQPTLAHLAGRISQQLEADSATLISIMSNDSITHAYGFDNQTFIAMFLPDTYEFYWTATPVEFVEKMHTQWTKFWNPEREKRRTIIGMTRAEVSTLASIVYEETKSVDEMATVAGVYINRLRLGMPLQADPTVKFALPAPAPKRILLRHLEIDSPYNTYKHTGLPPGPIAMPSVAAIDAVLNYQSHNYLYFAAKPDFSGRHNFASTLSEHNSNADAYRRALDKAGVR